MFVLTVLLMFSQVTFSRIIVFNINNGSSTGNLYQRTENVVVGDIIRFTNNLPYTITNTNGVMDCMLVPSIGQTQYKTIAPNAYVEIPIIDQSITNYTFIHDHFQQNKYYNNRLNLTFPLGTETFFDNNDFSFSSSNPVQDELKIIFKASKENVELNLFDMTGAKVFTQRVAQTDQAVMDLRGLSAGVYFLQIDVDNKKNVKRLLKN